MVSHSMTQVGKWSRRIGGGALVLALVGLPAPTTTSARIYEDNTPEVIEIVDEAPWDPSMGMGGHNGAGAPNYYPSGGDSGGGSGGGGGTSPNSGSGTEPLPVTNCGEFGSSDHAYCLWAQITNDCEQVFGGTIYNTMHYEVDANGEEVDSWAVMYCHIETQDAWMQIWYDPRETFSADPVEICSGEPGQPGTCWEP